MASHKMEAIETHCKCHAQQRDRYCEGQAAEYILGPFVSKAAQKVDVDITVISFGDFLADMTSSRAN